MCEEDYTCEIITFNDEEKQPLFGAVFIFTFLITSSYP